MRGTSRGTAIPSCRAGLAALLTILLASCTSATDPDLQFAAPGFSAAAPTVATAGPAEGVPLAAEEAMHDAAGPVPPAAVLASSQTVPATPDVAAEAPAGMSGDDAALPQVVAYLPSANPAATFPAVPNPPEASPAPQTETAAAAAEPTGVATPTPRPQAIATATPRVDPAEASPSGQYLTSAAAPTEPPKRKNGFLSSLFGTSKASAAANPFGETQTSKPIVALASVEHPQKRVVPAAAISGGDALPGVRQSALFEIRRKSGIDDDSDIDINENAAPRVQLASAAGLARLDPRGLLLQNESIDVACLKPTLLTTLKQIERHFGKKVVVTSGYRDPGRNARARGARNSLHMFCAAADVQVPGVSKWELASYARSLPGRGGVGTYCYTESVHIDIGPERDWDWRCRRRK